MTHFSFGTKNEVCSRCAGTGQVTAYEEDGTSTLVDCWHDSHLPTQRGPAKTMEERIDAALKIIKQFEGSEKWDWLERPRGKE